MEHKLLLQINKHTAPTETVGFSSSNLSLQVDVQSLLQDAVVVAKAAISGIAVWLNQAVKPISKRNVGEREQMKLLTASSAQ